MANNSSIGERPTGPRGGLTTQTETMVRKNLWLPLHLSEALRLRAFEERGTETRIICVALAQYLGVEESEEGQTGEPRSPSP